jgi:enterochelin esterase family protein
MATPSRLNCLATLVTILMNRAFATEPAVPWPEVRADGSVAFLLDAPRAKQVKIWGDWMAGGDGVTMQRTARGWTLTVTRLTPGPHLYCFFVDGLRVADPRNRAVKNGYPGISSIVHAPMSVPVPAGITHVHHYRNPETSLSRTVRVYTPSRYSPEARLPVLFLLHGSSDSDRDWLGLGQAAEILEDQMSRDKAKPMILVFPDGHPYPSLDVSTRAANLRMLRAEFAQIITPLVENRYHPAQGPTNWAIAGLSMGGSQALHLAALDLGRFGTVAAFSAPGDIPGGATLLNSWTAARDRMPPTVFRLWCGTSDPFFAEARLAYDQLRSLGLTAGWRETPGAHDWATWRSHLAELMQALFH